MQNLPRFTFLLGPRSPEKLVLYDALTKENPDVLPVLLNDVIDRIALNIFFSGSSTTPEWRLNKVKLREREVEMKSWWINCEAYLRNEFGPSALGVIALHTLLVSGDIDTYDNFFVPDVVSAHDLMPFYDMFRPDELVVIQTIGVSLAVAFPGVKTIILANETDVSEQMQQITRELSPVRLPNAQETFHG